VQFRYHRVYAGPMQAAIFDWAGTTVDYGSRAPVAPFVEVFRRRGVTVTPHQARGPMGIAKRDHIRALAALQPVSEEWFSVHGRPWTEEDVDAMYEEFVPLQVESAASHAQIIPGTVEAIRALRARGIKIGSCSGYNHETMAGILPAAQKQGYEPDSLVCPEDVPAGRPHPWMLYRSAVDLEVYPMSACVKVGDTVVDIEEGLNAGTWTIGLAKSGSELGLSEEETEALDPQELPTRLEGVYDRMYRAGAHYVVDTIAEVPSVLDEIEPRLKRGEQP
jgi:phosphonoacetaldehyde hydrolase